MTAVLCLVTQSCLSLCDPMDCNLPGSSVLGNSPGKNTRMGCHALLQGIFPTQGSNPGLISRQILYHLSHQGSPRILEWVAYPFSRGTSWPRSQVKVSCIASRFFTSWATREAPLVISNARIFTLFFLQGADNQIIKLICLGNDHNRMPDNFESRKHICDTVTRPVQILIMYCDKCSFGKGRYLEFSGISRCGEMLWEYDN